MKNSEISENAALVLKWLEEQYPDMPATEKLAILKSASGTVESTLQAEMTFHALQKLLDGLNK